MAKTAAASPVTTRLEDGVLWITLNRPEVLNAVDIPMHTELRAALKAAAAPDVRAVVLTGAGRGFCVGQDLAEFRELGHGADDHLRRFYNPNILALRRLEKPVIAAVNGVAAGAGLSFALACDLRICTPQATLAPAFVRVGLVPDSGASFFLSRLLGPAEAFTWLSTGAAMSAEDALAKGLVGEVVEADALLERVGEIAQGFAAAPTRALGLTKRLLERLAEPSLEEHLETEAQFQAVAAATSDHHEGVAAFLEKRRPEFTGA